MSADRAILHSDMNSFYASVEMMLDPKLRGKAVAVCGSTENRHGIVLAKSELAKRAGVKTGMVNWEAKQRCKDLILVPPQYDQYLNYSRLAHEIYYRYTDLVEPFGMDECWLDVTGCGIYGEPLEIAEEIRKSVREELGLTVSIGVSFNKIFAKLGSDLKKPDAITVITRQNFKENIWPLAASELLYVGSATTAKLDRYGSKKLVWWKGSCGHEWQTSVKARSAGERCPICAGVRIVPGINDLATRYPEIAAEWSERNRPLDPQMVSAGSHKKAYWRCRKGHEWLATIKSRTEGGNGCPYCSHRQVQAGYNDLASQRPELADEWSERNAPLRPDKVMVFSNRKAWWRCKLGHEWNTLISTRAGGSKCPYCGGLKLMKGFNDLSSCYPELSREWSEKNGRLLPEDVNERSTKNVWWKCGTCGYEYKAVIKSRVHGLKCPVCTQRAVLAGYNDLATTDPELVLEWDYDANERKPTEISRLSQYPVWWKGACGHKWKDKVFCRAVEGARCIYCEKEFVQVLPRLLVMVYAKQCGTKVSINDEKTIGILLDVLLPEVNLAFTFPSRETDRGAKVIEVMQYMCAARKIQLIEVRKKEPIELAHEIKQAFAKAHLYIDSDSEKEIDYLRKWYFHQTA